MGQSSAGGASAGLPETAPTAGLQAMFANNQATPRNQAAQLTQPQGNAMPQYQQPTAMSSASRPPAFAAKPASGGNPAMDNWAKEQGFQNHADHQAFVKTLPKADQGGFQTYGHTGFGRMAQENMPQITQRAQSQASIWQLKQQYPELFGGAGQNQQAPQMSMAQQLASQMNQR